MAWQQYDALLKLIETGVLVVDSSRRIHQANPAAQRLLGAREHRLIGRSLVEATLSYEVLNLVSAAQESGQPQQKEMRHNEVTGRTLRVQVFPLSRDTDARPETLRLPGVSASHLPEETPFGRAFNSSEASESAGLKEQAEVRQSEAHKNGARKNEAQEEPTQEEPTQEEQTQEEQTQQKEGQPDEAQKEQTQFLLLFDDVTELRRLETVRRDFVANVSHELRTPLASIRAMAETLQDGAINDTAVAGRFVNIIVGEVERLTRILEDLLILSRAESKLPERHSFVLSDLLRDVVERFQSQAEKAQVQLNLLVPRPLAVVANRDQIEQVLVNLIDNAIKYTQAGGRVEVTAKHQGQFVNVCVIDTGIGILSQDLPRLFERFYRVDKARSRQSGGTGLGLSIVKHIVETHGGKVTVESEYGHGSTFAFTLPVRD